MNTSAALAGSHLRTYLSLFQPSVSSPPRWPEVLALFRHLGQVQEEPGGNLKLVRNGHHLVLSPPPGDGIAGSDDRAALQQFLRQSETTVEQEARWLLVIDYHQARIFRSEADSAVPHQILPYDQKDCFRHASGSRPASREPRQPDPRNFYEPVARALPADGQLVVFGNSTVTVAEMEDFIAWLRLNHPQVAGRIIGSLAVDEHHLTEDQLLARAREIFASRVA